MRGKPMRIKQSYTKNCPICGKSFVTSIKTKTFCGKECHAEARRRKDRENYVPKPKIRHIACKYCGNIIEATEPHIKVCETCRLRRKAEEAKRHRDRMTPEKKTLEKAVKSMKERLRRIKKKRKLAIEHQEVLEKTATRYCTDGQLDCSQFESTIGIRRITMNQCECLRCGRTFFAAKNGSSVKRQLESRAAIGESPCPYCGEWPIGITAINMGSSFEREIASLYPEFTVHNLRPDWLDGFEIDLYSPDAKVGLELHGLAWHSDRFSKRLYSHKKKADLAEKAGVQLIQIYESEWIQRRECVIDKLDAIFHKKMKKVPARKLNVRIIKTPAEHKEVNDFMDVNHIQGSAPFQWGVALMDGEEIVAACCFRFGTGYAIGGQAENTDRYWELNRFATKLHTCVQGGLSRCISAFHRENPDVKEFYSFADRRWTCPTRSAYAASGFNEVGRQAPNYMYTDLTATTPLRNKQFMRKSSVAARHPEVFSPEKTELEMAHELGWYRIYDAGKIKYRYLFK
jgi:very-short-patch-repair endonuclease